MSLDTRKSLQSVVTIGRILALILAIFSAITYLITLVLGPVLFFSTADGLKESAHVVHQLPLDIFMLYTVYLPGGMSHGTLFAAIWIIFVVCIVAAGLSRGGFLKSVKEALSKPISVAKTNFLYLMPLVATGLLYATILITDFQTTQGIQTGSLNFPAQTSQYLILLNLAYAPIDEEFAFRITTIGVPLAVFLLIVYRSDPRLIGLKKRAGLFLLTLFSPELAKSRLGYKTVAADGLMRGISPLEWALILVSSAVFGLAHYISGGGWEIGKVSTAALAGFVFAVMYVSYGAYADILLHWFFNYYFTILDMASTAYAGAFTGFANFVEISNLFAGPVVLVFFLLVSALKISDYLTSRAAGIPTKTM
ncbi:MAG TPA: CPBP family glutamic-type intramembrane protease [Candidatus Acidoferrales bacterium]|nr:CPBP family glutamic-type intramembrane protease [Candidatus Acidoferrales bacterium]